MRTPNLEKLRQQKAAIEAAIRSAKAAQNRAEKAAQRREVAELVERAIRGGATAQQIEAAFAEIAAKTARQSGQIEPAGSESNHV